MNSNTAPVHLSEFILADDLAPTYPSFNKGQIKYLIRTRKTNGLSESGAILKIQRKLYVHKGKFAAWMLSKQD